MNDHLVLYTCGVSFSGVIAGPRVLPSHSCGLTDLAVLYEIEAAGRQALVLEEGWASRWIVTWRVSGSEVACPVRDLGSFPVAGCEPVRRFSWRTSQRHRPGLQFMVSTGRHHGFESIAEQRLLLALDFAGGVVQVLSQPHRMRFRTAAGWMEHTPDFLAVTRAGTWLVDVRPVGRVGEDDRAKFAASAEAALRCGWRYLVVGGWRRHVLDCLDTLAAQRRGLADPLGTRQELLDAASGGPCRFGDLVAATAVPAVGRAQALHLIWHRRLGIDLSEPLGDGAVVWPVRAGR